MNSKETFYRECGFGIYRRQCGSKRVIAFIGDSFTEGQGILKRIVKAKDHIYVNNRNYSHYFAKHFRDVDIINVGIAGGSNESILDSLYFLKSLLSEYEDVLVMFGTTSDIRTPLVLDNFKTIQLGLGNIDQKFYGISDEDWAWYTKYREAYHMVGTTRVQCVHKFARVLVSFQDHCMVNGYDWAIYPIFNIRGLDDIINNPDYRGIFGHHLDKSKVCVLNNGGKKPIVSQVEAFAFDKYGNRAHYDGLCEHFNEDGYKVMANIMYDEFKRVGYRKW